MTSRLVLRQNSTKSLVAASIVRFVSFVFVMAGLPLARDQTQQIPAKAARAEWLRHRL
jgi:hypothetical protein